MVAMAGVAIVRGFATPPSAQFLNKYCVPAEPLCGEVKLTAQEEPGVHATLLHRAVVGDFVVDHERVARTFPEGRGHIELVCTYEVRDGKIVDAWCLAGPKQIDR